MAWDEDSDDGSGPSTPQVNQPTPSSIAHKANDSTTTIQQIPPVVEKESENLKPEGRRSHDRQSQPDSEASYDLVSGATSRAPGSPKEDKAKEVLHLKSEKDEESDGEEWE